MTKYRADITALNAEKIGSQAHGYVEFTTEADKLHIKLEMFDTPANIQHWEHFHGFPDGKDAQVPTLAQDTNQDGFFRKKIFAKIPILIEINWGILLSRYIKSIKARRSKDQCKNG